MCALREYACVCLIMLGLMCGTVCSCVRVYVCVCMCTRACVCRAPAVCAGVSVDADLDGPDHDDHAGVEEAIMAGRRGILDDAESLFPHERTLTPRAYTGSVGEGARGEPRDE